MNRLAISKSSRMIYHVFFLMMVISIASCGILNSEEKPSLNIETEKDIYLLNEDEFIAVTIENTSGKTVYYSTCLARELEVLENGSHVDTIQFGVCYCLCPAELQPGDKVAADVSKMPIQYIKESEQLRGEESITYRLKYSLHKDKAWGDKPLPDFELRSNEFSLISPE